MDSEGSNIPPYYAWAPCYFLKEFAAKNTTFEDRGRLALRISCTPSKQIMMSMGSLRDNGGVRAGAELAPEFYRPQLESDMPICQFVNGETPEYIKNAAYDIASLELEGLKVCSGNKDYSRQVDIIVQTERGLEVVVAAEKPSTIVNGRLSMKITLRPSA